jgi:DNA-binding transcriptional ArsR family regulator
LYPSLEAAAQETARRIRGEPAGLWQYHYADGRVAAAVLRVNLPDGDKQYRPFHPVAGGRWGLGDPPGLWPLYRLASLDGQRRVYVVEGCKCADAATGIGLSATTSAHGAGSAHKSDWRPLRGRDVAILCDNDDGGRKYGADVAAILQGLTPPATVRIVELPGLAVGGDIVDFLETRDGADADTLRREIEVLADATATLPDAPQERPPEPSSKLPAARTGGLFIPGPILHEPGLAWGDKAVLAKLKAYAAKSGLAYCAVERYAAETSLKPRAVKRHLRRLEKRGFIRCEARGGGRTKTSRYRVLRP